MHVRGTYIAYDNIVFRQIYTNNIIQGTYQRQYSLFRQIYPNMNQIYN